MFGPSDSKMVSFFRTLDELNTVYEDIKGHHLFPYNTKIKPHAVVHLLQQVKDNGQ